MKKEIIKGMILGITSCVLYYILIIKFLLGYIYNCD